MGFHEIRFPAALSFGSSGGPERLTEIVTLANGFEERNSPWSQSRRRYDAGIGVRSLDDLSEILRFFEARHGQLYGFRWKDWLDFKSCLPSETPQAVDQVLTAGSDPLVYQLTRSYSDGAGTYLREITKPVQGTVHVALDGVQLVDGTDFTVDTETGLVTLATAPPTSAIITAGFEFDVPVRFGADTIEVNLSAFEAGEIPAIPIVEVRV